MKSILNKKGIISVPCDGCTLCCKNDAVRIYPDEDATKWKTELHPLIPKALMLAHKENRDCYYLGENGCTIQDDKPYMCRTGDCRIVAVRIPLYQAQNDKRISLKVWRKGKDLLKEMDKKTRREFIKMVIENGRKTL